MNKLCFRLFVAGCVSIGTTTAVVVSDPVSLSKADQAMQAFTKSKPRARFMEATPGVLKISDKQIATARTAKGSGEQALNTLAPALGLDSNEFIPVGPFPSGQHELGLMYQPDTGDYKFTAYYWTQTAGGIPVFRTRFMALVRNDVGFPTVHVTANTRAVGNFQPPVVMMVNRVMAMNAAAMNVGPNPEISEPKMAVYAGMGEKNFTPVTAMVFEASSGTTWDADYAKKLLVVDLATGQVVYEENMILHGVEGTVQGQATQGSGADECEAEQYEPLPYALVTSAGLSAYADENGDFQLNTSGTVTVNSGVEGRYFSVNNQSGSNGSASASINDGGSGLLNHNAANSSESERAEVNAYIQSNVVRDFVLEYHPDYPTVSTELDFSINVGVSGTCNAFYDGSSINFYNAGGGCNNTAFSVIVHHENGHHYVATGGSGQQQYGEGMSDCFSVLVSGDSKLARGFFQGDCVDGIRNADNSYQYGGACSGIHDCGQLISGCIWDSLQLLPLETVAALTVNSVPMHVGGGIAPDIFLDWLLLDDDDGDLDNGTPNSVLLTQAFALHNMSEIPEPLANDECGSATEITWGTHPINTLGGSTSSDAYNDAQCSGSSLGAMTADVWYRLQACGTGTMTVSTCDQISFDSDIVVYQGGSCGTKTQVGCNGDDGGCGGYSSIASVNVTEGETYFIRIGGWDGAAVGAGNIIVSGPGEPCENGPVVTVSYPDGRPDTIEPSGGTQVSIQIDSGSSSPVSGTESLNYRADGGAWLSQALSPQGGGSYLATFPTVECDSDVDWYISMDVVADGDGTVSQVTSPSGGASDPWGTTAAGDIVKKFEDDFQDDKGWTVSSDVSTGAWERVLPAGSSGGRCDAPTDADSSGNAYVTGNAFDEDVDGGTTTLESPDMDASEGGTLSYWRWYSNGSDCGGADSQNDIFEVEASSDGGNTWYDVETLGPTGSEVSGQWFQVNVDLDTLAGFTPSSNFRLRFICGDLNSGSVVEASVDGVEIKITDCGVACQGDIDGDGTVGISDFSLFLVDFGTSNPQSDFDGSGVVDIADFSIFLVNYGDCDS
jgi:hypothetical protein